MAPRLLGDADIAEVVTPAMATATMREAVLAAWRGELASPPRATVPIGDERLTFACGARAGDWFGYRSYVAPGSADDEQAVVVQDEGTGRVRAVLVGKELGPRRVGGIGAVALEAMGPRAPERIALIGTGTQAWHQLWALPPRFHRARVVVHSRSPERREAFAERARRELGLDVATAGSAAAAADGADVVVMATSSPTPVLTAEEVRYASYVATLGPKQVGHAEIGPDLADGSALVVSDSRNRSRPSTRPTSSRARRSVTSGPCWAARSPRGSGSSSVSGSPAPTSGCWRRPCAPVPVHEDRSRPVSPARWRRSGRR